MATTSYGTPYVQSSDLVSGWPAASLNVADRIDAVSYAGNGLNAQTGVSYTLVVGDAGKTVTLNNAAAVAVSLPQDSTANLPNGAVVHFYNLGAGTVTVSAGAGATLQGGSITIAQYGYGSVIKLSANTYGPFESFATAPALVYITSATISASASTIISNCFSSAYDVYQITFDNMTMAVGGDSIMMQLRTGATTATSNYNSQTMSVSSTTFTGVRATGGTQARMFQATQTAGFATATLFGPFLARATYGVCQSSYAAAGTSIELQHTVFSHTTATSYESLVVNAATSTISGTVRIYGLKNS